MYRLIAMPPGAPRAAVDTQRAAVTKLAADADYLNEAVKLMGDAPEYVTGAGLNDDVRRGLSIDPGLKAFMDAYAKRAK
jgi:tripartite-type tricarboxylate transporter receptor subunit TctC